MIPSEQQINELRASLEKGMSARRYAHTLGVEKEAARLGELFCPAEIPALRAAALLHDLTKEESYENQLQLCEKFAIIVPPQDRLSPKILHAVTAAALVPVAYPAFADPLILSCIRWHTTGHSPMTVEEKILYLADYIEETRTFPVCVALRNEFWNAEPQNMPQRERLAHLRQVLIHSYDYTMRDLMEEHIPICLDTVQARNALLLEEAQENG